VPQEVLLDNARALVDRHDAVTREVTFHARLLAAIGSSTAGLRALSSTDQGQGRARCRLRQAQMRLPATASPAGRHWRRILTGGCARLPIGAFTGRPARPVRSVTYVSGRSLLKYLDGLPQAISAASLSNWLGSTWVTQPRESS
jgi:hypothetical protein